MSRRSATSDLSPVAKLPAGVGSLAIDRLYPPEDPWIADPVGWFHDKLGHHLWSKQVEILESVRDNRMTAVKSCHGPGKSFTGSGVIGWYMDVHQLGSAFAVTTAPSWPQVQAILWREIRRRHREGDLRGRITLDCQWHMGDVGTKRADQSEELIAMGRKPADYDEDTFQGIHSRYFLAVLDEACGIPLSLWTSVLALVTNENARVLALGNPDDPNSHFAKVCKPGSGWNVIQISVWDTPNFTGDHNCAVCGQYMGDLVMESLVSKIWVETARQEWGEGSPTWVAKVDGEFPDVSDEYLISPALIQYCWNQDLPGLGVGRYGVDIARYGVDHSVIYRNRDGVVRLRTRQRLAAAGRGDAHVRADGPKSVFLPGQQRCGVNADQAVGAERGPPLQPAWADLAETGAELAAVAQRHRYHLVMLAGLDQHRQFEGLRRSGPRGRLQADDVAVADV